MNVEELIEEVIANHSTVQQWRSKYESNEWKKANQLNKQLFGMSLNQSPNCECIEDLYKVIYNRNQKTNIIMNQNKRFQLKKDRVIMLHNCDPVTHNSPEEKLIEALRLSPGHIRSFEVVPENWEEIVNGSSKKKSKPTKEVEETVEEVVNEEIQATQKDEDFTVLREQLTEKKNNELKDIIKNMGLELPEDTRKASLVEYIISNS